MIYFPKIWFSARGAFVYVYVYLYDRFFDLYIRFHPVLRAYTTSIERKPYNAIEIVRDTTGYSVY